MAYILTSTQVPSPTGYTGTLAITTNDTTGLLSPCAKGIAHGETTTVVSKVNEDMLRLDLGQTYGAGNVYGVARGLAITSVSGLNVSVSAGLARIMGLVQNAAAHTLTVNDNSRSFVWLKQNGTFIVEPDASTIPTGEAVFLGSVLAASGSVVSVDTSGVIYLRGGLPYREVADAGYPADSPNAAFAFLTRTGGGVFLWDGVEHSLIGKATGLVKSVAGSSNVTLSVAEARSQVWKFTGILTGNIQVIVPHAAYIPKFVRNATTGAYTLTVIGPSGSGLAVTQGKSVALMSDGTNIVACSGESAS